MNFIPATEIEACLVSARQAQLNRQELFINPYFAEVLFLSYIEIATYIASQECSGHSPTLKLVPNPEAPKDA